MKKMAILPHSMVERLMDAQREQQQLISDSPLNELTSLDREMKRILESKEPSDIKAKQYAQILHTYTGVRSNIHRAEQEWSAPAEQQERSTPDILTGLAKTYVNKGKLLMEAVGKNSDISWNNKNELLYKGSLIRGSNIIDLIHAYAKPTKEEPLGWREFGRALHHHNVPQVAIANKRLLVRAQAPEAVVKKTPAEKERAKRVSLKTIAKKQPSKPPWKPW